MLYFGLYDSLTFYYLSKSLGTEHDPSVLGYLHDRGYF